jgi:hypothetical protein
MFSAVQLIAANIQGKMLHKTLKSMSLVNVPVNGKEEGYKNNAT